MTKVLVVGGGKWGQNHVRQFHALGALAGIVDSDSARLQGLGAQYSGVALFSSLNDALSKTSPETPVVLATPVATHFELAKQVLEAGRDVLVEKPITMNASQAEALVALADKKKRVLMVGHLLIYQPAITRIKAALDEGLIGDLLSLHQDRLNLGTARSVENALWSLGVHDVAVLLYLLDQARPEKVAVTGQSILTSGVEDDVYVHLSFGDGKRAHLHNSWLWPEKQRRLTLIGTQGMLVYDEGTQQVIHHKKRIGSDLKNVDQGTAVLFEGAGQPLELEARHFIECIERRSRPHSDGASAVTVTQIIEQACAAMKE